VPDSLIAQGFCDGFGRVVGMNRYPSRDHLIWPNERVNFR